MIAECFNLKELWETEGAGIMDIGAGMDMITPQSVRSDIPGVTRSNGSRRKNWVYSWRKNSFW